MSVRHCWYDQKPGYRWGSQGTPHTYLVGNIVSEARAKARAKREGRVNRQASARKQRIEEASSNG